MDQRWEIILKQQLSGLFLQTSTINQPIHQFFFNLVSWYLLIPFPISFRHFLLASSFRHFHLTSFFEVSYLFPFVFSFRLFLYNLLFFHFIFLFLCNMLYLSRLGLTEMIWYISTIQVRINGDDLVYIQVRIKGYDLVWRKYISRLGLKDMIWYGESIYLDQD